MQSELKRVTMTLVNLHLADGTFIQNYEKVSIELNLKQHIHEVMFFCKYLAKDKKIKLLLDVSTTAKESIVSDSELLF